MGGVAGLARAAIEDYLNMKSYAWRFGRGEPQVRGWRPLFLGPVTLAFGVLECGLGWSRRYRGFRVLWKGNDVWTVRLDGGASGLEASTAVLDATFREDVRAVRRHLWARLWPQRPAPSDAATGEHTFPDRVRLMPGDGWLGTAVADPRGDAVKDPRGSIILMGYIEKRPLSAGAVHFYHIVSRDGYTPIHSEGRAVFQRYSRVRAKR